MQNWFLGKIFNIVRFISANGPGKGGVTADEVASGAGSAISKILTTIVEVLSDAVYWLWGLFMTAVYTIIKLLLNIVDVLQFFVMKLVGIDVYSNPNWKNVLTLRESDLIIKLITSDTVLNIFSKVAIISAVLIIIFCIFAIVKQNYTEAIGGESKGNAASKALKDVVKSIFLCFLVPFLLIVGILGSNVILASVCSAIKGNNNLTLGGVIFTASSYDANRYRLYARNGMRTPMYYTTATEIVNPSEYTSDDDMRVLFYQLVMGDVYIESLSEELQAELEKGTSSKYNFSVWYDTFKNFEIDGALDEGALKTVATVAGEIYGKATLAKLFLLTGPAGLIFTPIYQAIQGAGETVDDSDAYQGNEVMQAFETDFKAWYKENFNSVPLDDLYFANEHIKSIYKTNWTKNDSLVNTAISFSATYREAGEYPFPSNPSKTVTIFANSDAYSIYEPFATYELEYYVMADFIDYAIEHNTKFYFINANNSIVNWNMEDEKQAINSYDAECEVYSYSDNEGIQYVIQRSSDSVKEVVEKDGKYLYRDTIEATKLSSDAFYVSYYNGVNKLYWSCDGTMSEKDGSTYIICVEKDGKMVPVTQKTTSFRSAFLASDYDGPIVARGVFAKYAMPGSTQYPTAIREQLVDEDGNAINTLEKMSTIGSSAYNVVNIKNEGGTETIVLSNTFKNLVEFSEDDRTPITDKSESSSLLATVASKVKDEVLKTELSEVMSNLVVYDSGENCKKIGELGVSADNIYVNSTIAYYQIVGDNQIRFYDSLGRKMALTNSDEDKNSDYIQATSISDIYCHYAIGKDHIYRIYLDYNASTKDLESHLTELINDTDGYKSTVIDYNSFIFIRYSGKLVNMKVGGNSVSMIVGMTADGIMQQGMNGGVLVKSGAFRTYEPVTTITNASFFANPVLKDGKVLNSHTQIGIRQTNNNAYPMLVASTIDIYRENYISLYIKNGEVYYTNGKLFFGKEDAIELFDNLKDSIGNISTVEVANYLNASSIPDAYLSSVNSSLVAYNEIRAQMQIVLSADPFTVGSITETNVGNLQLTENLENYQYFYFDSNSKQIEDVSIINDESSGTYTIKYGNTVFANLSKEELEGKFADINNDHVLYCRYISRYEDDGKVIYDPNNKSINCINALEGALYYSGDDPYLNYRKKCAQDAFAYTANFLYGSDLIIGIGSAVQELPSAYYDIKVVEKIENDTETTEKVNISYYTSGGKQLKTIEAVKADQIHSEITKDLYVYYTQNGTKFSNIIVSTSELASLVTSNGGENKVITITMSADFTRYKLQNDSYLSLDLVAKIINVNASECPVPFTLKNGALYCNNKLVLTLDAIKNIAIQGLNKDGNYSTTSFYTAGDTAGTYNDRYIYFEYGGFGINPFANIVVDLAFHIDVSSALKGKPIAVRLKINMVNAYETKVTYRLEGGGFLLNYNFRQDTGIGLSWLMDMKYVNPLVLCLSTGIVFNMLWKMVWGLISRIYEIAIQFIILPGVLAVDVMSPGKFGDWSKNIIKKVMVAYSALIMINLYYALIPSISELTSGLIYWDDLPSTFTSWFSNINIGLSSIGGNIANNLQSFSSNTLGTIGIKLNSLLGIDEASKVAISGFLNKIIFILFFMVLTTLVTKGKDLIGDYINSGDIVKDGSGVFDSVKGLTEEYNKSIPGRVINGSVKAGGKALVAGAKGIKSAVGRARTGGEHEYTGDDFTSEGEGDGTDRATAVSTLSNTSASELASALTSFTPPINLVVNATGSNRSTGRGVPITNTMPNGNEEEKHTESHGASVMNGSGGFGGGGDDGSSSWAGKNHGSGTAYYGGGGGGGMSNAYVDDSYLVDNNMSISQMEEHLYGLADEMSKSKGEASKLMKESRATYTKQDATEHAQVKTDLANLDDALVDSVRERNNIDPNNAEALNSVNDVIRQINQESAELHKKDKELDEKKAKSEELKSQAQMAKEHYEDVVTEMHAYQLARETKIKATEAVTSDEKLQVGEKANPNIDKNLTDDDLKDMAKMYRDEADEAKKKMEEYKDLANMVYTDLDRKNAEGIEKRIKEAEERIKKEQEAHGKAYDKVRQARANGASTADAEKERELASQNIRNIQAEINAYQRQLDAINDKKKAQEDAMNLADEERKRATENIKEAKAYEHEDERREKEKSPVTHGELDEIKTTINRKADAEKTGVLIDNVNKNIRKDMQDQLRTKADAKITDVNFSRTKNAVETLDKNARNAVDTIQKSKADAKATATELDKHAKVIDKNTQNITKKADATKVAEKLNEVKKQKSKEFNFIKVDLGSDDDKKKKDKK